MMEGKKRENVLLHVGEVNGEKTKRSTIPDQLKDIKSRGPIVARQLSEAFLDV